MSTVYLAYISESATQSWGKMAPALRVGLIRGQTLGIRIVLTGPSPHPSPAGKQLWHNRLKVSGK